MWVLQQELSSFALVLCSWAVLVLIGWSVQRPSGHCAGSGPEAAAFACSSFWGLWVGASLGLEVQKQRKNMVTNIQYHHNQCRSTVYAAVSIKLLVFNRPQQQLT